MPVAGKLYKLSWGGSLFGVDEWSNSLMIGAVAALPSNPSAYLGAINNWHAASGMSAARLEYIKFNEINPLTGKYANLTDSFTHQIDGGTPGTKSPAPAQLTLAMTLMTVRARGRGSKGRIFPPIGISSVELDGRLAKASADALCLSFKTFIVAVNAANGAGTVVVFSKIGQSTTDVTRVACGRVVDTQRRRRSALVESPSILPLV